MLLKEKLITDLKEYTKKTLDKYELLNLSTLEKYLANYYANTKKNINICEYCKQYESDNLRSLARHRNTCKHKNNNLENNDISKKIIKKK